MKVDLKKQIETYNASHGRFCVVTVPALQFLMIDGHGDPNTSQCYRDALATIYPVAYKMKFFSKQGLGRDYTVMPLEALWWAEDMDTFTSARDKSRWDWTLMNMVPGWMTQDHFEDARKIVAQKGQGPAIDALRLETLDEGQSVQTLHIGPYDDEGPVLAGNAQQLHSRRVADDVGEASRDLPQRRSPHCTGETQDNTAATSHSCGKCCS